MMTKLIAQFNKDESGVTAVEYGLMAFVVVAAMAAVTLVYGPALAGAFSGIATAIAPAAPAGG